MLVMSDVCLHVLQVILVDVRGVDLNDVGVVVHEHKVLDLDVHDEL